MYDVLIPRILQLVSTGRRIERYKRLQIYLKLSGSSLLYPSILPSVETYCKVLGINTSYIHQFFFAPKTIAQSDGIVLIVSKLSDNIAKFCKLLPDTANDLCKM